MSIDYVSGEHPDEANRRVVRFFGICLGVLVFAYALLSFRLFLERGAFEATDLLLMSARALLGAAALVVMLNPGWLARLLDREVGLMGRLFEDGFANAGA